MQIKRDRMTILLLCAVAGVIDVIGYIGLSHVFTANMTGNIVLLGIGVGDAREVILSNAALALIGFIIGVAVAVFVKKTNTILFWEIILLILVAIVIQFTSIGGRVSAVVLFVLSAAMGMQTIAGRNLKIAGLSSTVLTSTLAALIEGIMLRIKKGSQKLSTDAYLRGGAIFLYLAGASAASLSLRLIGLTTIWLGIAILAFVLLVQNKEELKQMRRRSD
ncbi:Uncharacterized membrane protein YoaK, UPF0700 family [Terribacillus aidingensis]|uniref:Uncharacterized membrane protein YoaK, UPF0700 family n=1 Tax=Terribacillus aidingensis TaxID=586416 RepID=A0A285N3R1_9BACI|nr:YoaK family protein [Terribacillus aidingensis]SNZ02626.1 Uncharacterized membrane protein YoaK, UPF0700 family [Terribacillus aidingensis]